MAYNLYKEALHGKLPHPPIPLSIYLVVEEALCAAWKRLRAHPRRGFDLLTAAEDIITHELYEILYDEIFNKGIVRGFDNQLLAEVTREPKVCNYDGTMLDKMPDLRIGFIGRSNVFRASQDAIFIECKPVDTKHPVGTHYCDKGIIRFVCGEYAWAMTSALMIGYPRSGYTISPKLVDALKLRVKKQPTITPPCPCPQSKPGQYSEVVYFSEHSRTFCYVETGQKAPSITIRHLWLSKD